MEFKDVRLIGLGSGKRARFHGPRRDTSPAALIVLWHIPPSPSSDFVTTCFKPVVIPAFALRTTGHMGVRRDGEFMPKKHPQKKRRQSQLEHGLVGTMRCR